MKRSLLASIVLSVLGMSSVAHAAEQSITAGYAQAHVQDFKNINGMNLKYRYEWESPLSLMASFSFMSGSKDYSYLAEKDIIDNNAQVKYYSLAMGPAWRFNEFVSVYGLLGASYSKVKYNYNWKNYEGDRGYVDMGNTSGSNNSTALAYNLGVQVNPIPNLVLDLAYEGSSLNDGSTDRSLNGFNVGIGYRF